MQNNKEKSLLLFSKMTKEIKTLNSIYETSKNKNEVINSLFKSSKRLIRNKLRYNSYIELPKFYKHTYPYKPNTSKTLSENSIEVTKNYPLISSYENNEKRKNINSTKNNENFSIFFNKLNNIKFVLINASVNEDIFFDFIDRSNINTRFKNEYNNYIESHPINKNINSNVYRLVEIMRKYKIEESVFFDKKSYQKINEFKTKDNISIKLKISSLMIVFYKRNKNIRPKKIRNLNLLDSINSIPLYIKFQHQKELSVVSKIYFPFEFLAFFYGLNSNNFSKFLVSVINYNYHKNNFNLDFSNFIKAYSNYMKQNTLYSDKSYFKIYNEKTDEYLAYNWDVTNNKITENYSMKIFLPKIKISIGNAERNNCFKFFYSLEAYKICHLMKENFKLWDFYVLKFFSDYKIFRQEINRIMFKKYTYKIPYNIYNVNKYELDNKNISIIDDNSNKNLINFNKSSNRLKRNIENFQFFYSRKINSSNIEKNENYFFELEIPKIHVNYQQENNFLDKFFDLNMKKLLQFNKLKKSFQVEDIIKFSIDVVDEKKNKTKKIKKLSFFENNKFRKVKKSATISSDRKQIRNNIKYLSFKDDNNENKIDFNIKKRNSIILPKSTQETKKDIKLNLDKYIFNFDEDILRFIKPHEKRKNDEINNVNKIKKIKRIKIIKDIPNNKNNKNIQRKNLTSDEKNINIELGKMKLIWTEKDLKEYEYIFEDKENQYLLDNPSYLWNKYIETRIDKFKEQIKN